MRLMHFVSFLAVSTLILGAGCQSKHEEGVKSNLRTQWTDVAADTRATTTAAEAVLREEGLKDVSAQATNVDGKATGKLADGTKVTVSVEKKTSSTSQLSVNVGTLGDPKLGAEIARKVRLRVADGDAGN